MKDEDASTARKHKFSTTELLARAASRAGSKRLINVLRWNIEAGHEGILLAEEFHAVGRGDLVAIHPDGIIDEYELKLSSSNLNDELRLIEVIRECQLFGVSRYERVKQLSFDGIPEQETRRLINRYCMEAESSKYLKHEWYLDREQPTTVDGRHKPNRFYIVTPALLASTAIRRLAGSPYGVICVSDTWDVRELKPAEFIHYNKIQPDDLIKGKGDI